MTVYFAGLEVLVPEGERLPPGDTVMIPLNLELTQPPAHFGLLMPLSQKAQKDMTVPAGRFALTTKGKLDYALQWREARVCLGKNKEGVTFHTR